MAYIGTKNVSEPDRTPINFVRNGEKCKMHKIDWCEGGLQLAYISTKNVSEPDLTPRMKYIMVFLQNCFHSEQHCFHLDRQFSCSSTLKTD